MTNCRDYLGATHMFVVVKNFKSGACLTYSQSSCVSGRWNRPILICCTHSNAIETTEVFSAFMIFQSNKIHLCLGGGPKQLNWTTTRLKACAFIEVSPPPTPSRHTFSVPLSVGLWLGVIPSRPPCNCRNHLHRNMLSLIFPALLQENRSLLSRPKESSSIPLGAESTYSMFRDRHSNEYKSFRDQLGY